MRLDDSEIPPHEELWIKVCRVHERQLASDSGRQLVSGNSRRDPLSELASHEADMVPG